VSDSTGRCPVDGDASEPGSVRIKVAPCKGCGGLPHGSVNETINCLERGIAQRDRLISALKLELDALRLR
jgi:hypothetical protein